MEFPTGYARMVYQRLETITSFAGVTDLAGLKEVWRGTQEVLEVNEVKIPKSDELPVYDVDIPAFQRLIMNGLRPKISNAVTELLAEPSRQGITMIKEAPAERIEAIHNSGILDEDADYRMMMSSAIYLKFSLRLDIASTYFMSKSAVSNDLLWQMRVLFAIYGLRTGVLSVNTEAAPYTAHAFSAVLIEMIKPHLNFQLATLLEKEDPSTLTNDYGITLELVDRTHEARLILNTTKERAKQVFRPTWSSRLRNLLRR